MNGGVRIVTQKQALQRLAAWLGDRPDTVLAAQVLLAGNARAAVADDLAAPRAAVIQAHPFPEEPIAYGDDAPGIWRALGALEGWDCVNLPLGMAQALRPLVEPQTGPLDYLGDVYYRLPTLPPGPADPRVRRLTGADVPLVERSRLVPRGGAMGSVEALLRDGYAAGAEIEGRLVSLAYASAFTPLHADTGVETVEAWRNQGLATATARLVAGRVFASGRTPVWSTGGHNVASQRVAEKLGFVEVARREYLILPRPDLASGSGQHLP